jgi:hypothetical protein
MILGTAKTQVSRKREQMKVISQKKFSINSDYVET